MKAVVFAAGYGTRLGELTGDTAKAMLPVAGQPLLEHVIRHLARHGFDDIAVNLHFRAEQIRDYFHDGSALGVRLTYSYEPELLGTAGTIASLRWFLCDAGPFLIHYGDVITDHDFSAMRDVHLERDALLTLLVHERPGSNSIVVLDASQRVTEFLERPTPDHPARARSSWVNSGVYITDPRLLDLLPPPPSDLAQDVLPGLAGRPDVFAHALAGFRVAVDSPARYREAEEAVTEGRLVREP
jgi:mannose-1-phosphate guanylyltransferase/phosphomannomutase